MKRLLLCLGMMFTLGLLASCTQSQKNAESKTTSPDGAGQAKATPTVQKDARIIGLSVLTLTNPFFKEIADNMRDEAAKHGYQVLVVSGEFDPAIQRIQVRDFIAQKVSAIVLTPCDSQAVGEAVRMANDEGIPVFTADIACQAKGVKVVSHIATDNETGGRQAAKAIDQALGGKGKVAIIDQPTVESSILRTNGFKAELAAIKSGVQIIGSWTGKGSKDESFKVAQEVLQAHPDLNGVFAVNDPTALGVFAALEIARKTDQVKIVGFDGQPEGKKAIREGKIFADPIQFPDKIGRETVKTIMKYFDGEEVSPKILIPTSLYMKADADNDASLK